jgi:thiamine pyrophosphokinase
MGKSMRALLSLSGTLPPPKELQRLEYDLVIAADGSAWQLLERGIVPDLIVGDLDSFRRIPQPESAFPHSEIVHEPDQNSTDFEKALRTGLGRGVREFIIVGINGGEFEHALNNWRLGRTVNTRLSLPSRPGELISLVPQPRVVISSRGLVWELDCEVLELGKREGARNESRDSLVELTVHEGSVLVFYDASRPERTTTLEVDSNRNVGTV